MGKNNLPLSKFTKMNAIFYQFVGDLFSEQYVLPRHINISSRQVNYWKGKKILPFFTKEKHGKMNIPQSVWLFTINELSKLGIDSTRLAQLSKDVWDKPRQEKYLDHLMQKELSKNKNRMESGELHRIEHMLEDERLMRTLRTENNYFTDAVKATITNDKTPSSLLYFPNKGTHFFVVGDVKPTLKINNLMQQEPFVCIPLVGFIKTIVTIEFENIQRDSSYLSQIENQLKDIIIYKRPKYIELVTDNEQIKPLIIREEHKNAEQLAAFFLQNKLPKNAKLLIEPRAQDNYKLTLITK